MSTCGLVIENKNRRTESINNGIAISITSFRHHPLPFIPLFDTYKKKVKERSYIVLTFHESLRNE